MNSEEKHFINQRKMQKTITRDTIVKQRRVVARILGSKFGINFRTKKIMEYWELKIHNAIDEKKLLRCAS